MNTKSCVTVTDDHVRAFARDGAVQIEHALAHNWNVTNRPLVGRDPDMTAEEIAARAEAAARMDMSEEHGEDFAYGDALMDTSLPQTPDIATHPDSFDIMGWTDEPRDIILFHGAICPLVGAPA